jgi:hypothetical protein
MLGNSVDRAGGASSRRDNHTYDSKSPPSMTIAGPDGQYRRQNNSMSLYQQNDVSDKNLLLANVLGNVA